MSFRLIFEVEPPRAPDLGRVMRQLDIFGPIADAILVPDNHLGNPALSSVALAVEIKKQGLRPIAAINARDRNLLRLESDLLTLLAYGVDEVLFLYGDPVGEGRSSLTVARMLDEDLVASFKAGALARWGRPLGWREKADFLLTKLDFGRTGAQDWRRSADFRQPLYCGVIALPDLEMAKKILNNVPDMELPAGYLAGFDGDPEYGFEKAIDELDALYRSGIDGAQLVVPSNRRRFAEMLEKWTAGRGLGASVSRGDGL